MLVPSAAGSGEREAGGNMGQHRPLVAIYLKAASQVQRLGGTISQWLQDFLSP